MVDGTSFDSIFELLQSGVYIVTADDGKEKAGCTAVWICRASFEPPMVAVFLAPKRHTHDVIKRAGAFCVNVVGEHHRELARQFGLKSGWDGDKYSGISFEAGKGGAPILKDACAFLDCQLAAQFEAGDHTCFVGRVIAADKLSFEKPLLYFHEDFYPAEKEATGQ